MDLSDPGRLASVIVELFNEELESVWDAPGVSAGVLLPLITPGLTYGGDLTEVDEQALREAIRAIVENLSSAVGITVAAVAQALASSACHYLWFC